MIGIVAVVGITAFVVLVALYSMVKKLLWVSTPNEVLIFSGTTRQLSRWHRHRHLVRQQPGRAGGGRARQREREARAMGMGTVNTPPRTRTPRACRATRAR